MTRSYNAIDADGHVLEPPDMWLTYMESKYHDRAPRIVINEHGKETFQIKPGKILPMPESSVGIGSAVDGILFREMSLIGVASICG